MRKIATPNITASIVSSQTLQNNMPEQSQKAAGQTVIGQEEQSDVKVISVQEMDDDVITPSKLTEL